MIRHAVGRAGFTTLCEKDAGRVKWTKLRAMVTCPACRKALDQGALMQGATDER